MEVENLLNEINKNIEDLYQMIAYLAPMLFESEPDVYYIFKKFMDILKDSMLGIEEYFQNGIGQQDGLKCLKFYGLIQLIITQQDTINEIYKLKKHEINYNSFGKIRELRNDVVGHPTNNKNGKITYLKKDSITNKTIKIVIYNKNADILKIVDINYRKMIIRHLKKVNECLNEIYNLYPAYTQW